MLVKVVGSYLWPVWSLGSKNLLVSGLGGLSWQGWKIRVLCLLKWSVSGLYGLLASRYSLVSGLAGHSGKEEKIRVLCLLQWSVSRYLWSVGPLPAVTSQTRD